MAISVGPALCVDAMGVANAHRNLVYSPCNMKFLKYGRGDVVRGNLRAGAILTRLRRNSSLASGRTVVGRNNGLFGRERFGRLRVRVSRRSEDDKDLRFAQQVRERSDSEGEEDGLREGTRVEEYVSATSVSALQEEDSIVPDLGSRRRFRNRFLGLVKLRTNIAEAAEGVFKSEIRRRIFVTIVLLMASRAGYFVPLPGFDRRSMPGDYLGFVSGAVGKDLAIFNSKLLIF